ncbi:MAG: YncE family protein [Thermoplasmata archaeon]
MLFRTKFRLVRFVSFAVALMMASSIFLSGASASPVPSVVGHPSPGGAGNPEAFSRSNLNIAGVAPQSNLRPYSLLQSTFSFVNDTLRPGNEQPSTLAASGVVAAAPGVEEVLVGMQGALVAIGASNGSVLWTTPLPGEWVLYLAIDAAGGVGFAVLSGQFSGIVEVGLTNGSVLAHNYAALPNPIAYDPVSDLVYQTEVPWEGLVAYYPSNLTEAAFLQSYSGGDWTPAGVEVTVDPLTGDVFVTTEAGWGQIVAGPIPAGFSILSPHTGSILNETYICGPSGGSGTPDALAFDSRNNTVFVLCTNASGTSLYVQSAVSAQTVAVVPLPEGWMAWGGYESSLVYVPQTDSIVIGNDAGGFTSVNATSYRISANTTASLDGGGNVVLAQGGSADLLYGINPYANEVNAFDPSLNARVFSYQFAPLPLAPTFVDQRGELWVAGAPSADSVSIINTTLGRVVGSVGVGLVPDAMAYDATHGDMWVANALSGNVSVVNAAARQVVATVPVGSVPVGLTVVPSFGEVVVAEESGFLSGSTNYSATLTVINDSTFSVERVMNLSVPQNVYPSEGLPTTIVWDSSAGRIIVEDAYYFWRSQSSPSVGFWSIDPAHLAESATPVAMQAYNLAGLGYDDSDGGLYATGWLSNTSTNETLWRVDPYNGTFDDLLGNLSSNTSWEPYSDTGAYSSNILSLSGTPWVAVVVTNGSGYRLSFFNTTAPGFAAVSFPLGSYPLGLQWNPTDQEVYAGNYGSASISWFD